MLNMVEEIFAKERKKIEVCDLNSPFWKLIHQEENRGLEEKKKKGEIESFIPLDTNPDHTTIGKITIFIINKLENCLLKNEYTDKNNANIREILCRVILYRYVELNSIL
jgi:hypothetical protein